MNSRRNFIKLSLILICCLASVFQVIAQSRSNQLIQVLVAPNKADWTYSKNEEITFHVSVLKNHVEMKDVEVSYSIGLEKMKPSQEGKLKLKESNQVVGKGIKIKDPGFVRCEVKVKIDGENYRGIATAGVAPLEIKPTQVMPNDFLAFWQKEKANAQAVNLDPKLTFIAEKSTDKVNVYHVSFQNNAVGSRIYAMLTVPRKAGKYPAVLQVPGAGIRPYEGHMAYAENGIITLQIGIHGIPVNLPTEVYNNLNAGALKGYPFQNLDDKDQYYYKRVYLGCVRAIDFIYQLPEFDGQNLVVQGGSQGGALSIITAALDDRVKGLVSIYPALSDLTGYLHNRAGGWPHMFNDANAAYMRTEQKIKNSAYYDVVNFAAQLKVPGFYTWGYNDETCPPTSYYSAYNLIQAPKELYLVPETGHWTFTEQQNKISQWVMNFFK